MKYYVTVENRKGEQMLGNGYGQGIIDRYKSLETLERYYIHNPKQQINKALNGGMVIKVHAENGGLIKTYKKMTIR